MILNRFLVVAIAFGAQAPLQSAPVILNEYNTVSGSKQLDEGMGADSFFGTIDGNGGNWFELLVIDDHVDLRGWKFDWTEAEVVDGTDENAVGSISLGTQDIWSDLRSGSILTFIETVDGNGAAGFDTSTDTSYDPTADDWWINIATQEEQGKGVAGLVSTITNDGEPGDFSVGNDDWTLTILDANGDIVFGPAGEGIENWAGGNINSEEGGSLEGPIAADGETLTVDDWKAITPANDFYDDTGSTSFGAPNADYNDIQDPPVFVTIQDLSALRDQVSATPLKSGDFDNNGLVDAADIDALSVAVRESSTDEKFDVNSDGAIDEMDRKAWVEQIQRTYFGDSNLDNEFGSQDFVFVFQANQYEDDIPGNSTWSTGDWNGDGDFTTTDFVAAFQAGGYEKGPRPAALVPEPSANTILLFVVICTTFIARRRS